jgi:hypothetical protein
MIKALLGLGSLAVTAEAIVKPRQVAPLFQNVNAVVGHEF